MQNGAPHKSVMLPLQKTLDPVEEGSLWIRLRRNVSIGIAGAALSVALKFCQTALLIKFLAIDDYGRLLIVLNLFSFLDSFFGLRVSDVIYRFFQPLKENAERHALRGVLWLCLGICFASGVTIYLVVFLFSPWFAAHLYASPTLTTLFKIYGLTVLLSAFAGLYEPILRIHDRVSSIVLPQIAGALITLLALCAYFASLGGQPYDLRIVVAAFVVGSAVQIIVPLTKTLSLIWPLLAGGTRDESFISLRRYRPELIRCFFNSNLSGYLKFAINPGDIFLLGLFSSPAQVAIYGLAKQLAAPLAMLQTTIQTAITPEISALAAKLQLNALRRLVSRYLVRALVFGGMLAAGILAVGHLLITHVLAADYKNSLPVFYCLVVAAWLLLVLLVFRPLALSLDLLRWHNAALMLSTALLAVVVVAHSLNALTLAGIQLAEAAILRPAFAALVWQALRQSVTSDQASTA